jgi:PAS domain S-box-containing protein
MKNNLKSPAGILRQKAEELLKKNAVIAARLYSEAETLKLIHELEVHQVELEMQNEELRRARAVAEVATSKYADLYDFAPTGYFSISKTGKIIELNLHGSHLLGADRSKLTGRQFNLFVSEDTRPLFNAFLLRVLIAATTETCEVTMVREGKQPAYVHIDGIMSPDNEMYLLTMVDISVHRQDEAALKESEERFQLLFNKAPLGYQSLDGDGNFIEVNQQWLDMLGYPREEVIGKWFGDFLSPGYQDAFRKRFPVFKAQGHIHSEFEMLHKDGSTLFIAFDGRIGNDLNGNFKQTHCILQDVTEVRKVKETLELTRQSYLDIINTVSEAIYVIDEAGTFIDVNKGAEKMYLYDKQELVGKTPADVSAPGLNDLHKIQDRMQSVFQTGVTEVFEFWGIRKNGEVFPKEVIVNRGHYFGKVVLVATARDITERKQADALFRDIIEKNPISIQILNMDGYTIQTNSAHTKLFGVKTPADYSIFKDTQLLKQGLGNLFDRIKQGEVVYFPDSHFNVHGVDPSFPDVMAWIKVVGFTLHDENGVPDRVVLMHENITERKHAEALFQDIVDKNPMSIQIVDKDGCTVSGNPAYTRLFGALPPPGFSIFADLQGKDPELGRLISLAKSGEVVHLPDLFYNPHDVSPDFPDNPLWIRAIIFPLNDIHGKPERFVFMHENITERKQAEIALKKKSVELENFNQLMVGREIKMIDLKQEINELCLRLGEKAKYHIHT